MNGVLGGSPLRFSASQIESFRLCLRKWSWRSRYLLDAPQGKGAGLGEETHVQLQHYLAWGRPLDLTTQAGLLAMELLPYLPPPPQPRVEEWFDILIGGYWIGGKMDLVTEDGVWDHKTTGDLGWAKRNLHSDPQGAIYAARWFAENPTKELCVLRWNYVCSKNRKTLPIHEPVTREMIAPELRRVVADCAAMTLLAETPTAEMAPVITSCETFGGCAYKGPCHLPPSDALIAAETMRRRRDDAKRTARG